MILYNMNDLLFNRLSIIKINVNYNPSNTIIINYDFIYIYYK